MLVLVKANVLAIGLSDRVKVLDSLSIRVSNMRTSRAAGSSLKNEKIDSIISCWNLPDSPNGQFLKALRNAKPYLTMIVIVDAGDISQEIAARSIGAAAVLSSDVSDEIFRQTVSAVLNINDDVEENQKIGVIADARKR